MVGKEDIILWLGPSFCLFAEESFLSNYRGNIQFSSHVLPYDWRKYENRSGWAHGLNSRHDLTGAAPRQWMQRKSEALLSCMYSTHFLRVEKQANLVSTKNAEHLQCFQKGTCRPMCGTVRLAEPAPYKTTDMQTWVSFSQATRAPWQWQNAQKLSRKFKKSCILSCFSRMPTCTLTELAVAVTSSILTGPEEILS